MKILWIINNILPPLCKKIGIKEGHGGGWLYSSLKKLLETNSNDKYSVASVWEGNEFLEYEIDNVTYFLLPLFGKSKTKYNKKLESYWKIIKQSFQPDIIHIHGSELPHSLSFVRACGSQGVILSLQGIISEIAKHYLDGLPLNVIKSKTLRDIIRKDNLLEQKLNNTIRGRFETELISKIDYVVGRTEWDRIHAKSINPNLKYFFCGETLRDSFYRHNWKYENCIPHTIFLSQAYYPIKGLHIILKSLTHVIKEFPDLKLYIGGINFTNLPWYKISSYGKYINSLLNKYNLKDKIHFTGPLSEHEICQFYLKSNLFICPSTIENSSNSIGEAQLLKMPILCSYVGGNPEIVNYDPIVLYRFSDDITLAKKICDIFIKKGMVEVKNFDTNRYNPKRNLDLLLNIYKTVFIDSLK